MKSKSEKRFGASPLTPVEHAKKRILKHLRKHPEGVSTGQLLAWVEAVRSGGAIALDDFQAALRELRSAGTAASTNDLWHLRGAFKEPPPLPPIDSDDLPIGGLFARLRPPGGT
jgi:hypothetical protein